jgi:hypothetical protein
MPKSPSLIVVSCFDRVFRKDRAKCRFGHRSTAPGGEGGNALPTGGKVRPPAETGKIAPFFAGKET